MKENLKILFEIHKFYKLKTIFHWVSIVSLLLGIIFYITAFATGFVTSADSIDDLNSVGEFSSTGLALMGVGIFLFVTVGFSSFVNAILGIFGYSKMGSLPLVSESESIVENQALKTKGLLSLIGGWVFPLLAIVMDFQIKKATKHAANFGKENA